MKLPKIHKRNHKRKRSGAVILVIVVLIFLLIFLGYTFWEIWKMLRNLPRRTNPPDSSTAEVQQVAGELLQQFAATNGAISQVITQVTVLTGITPFEADGVRVIIWRSTNLQTWEAVATNAPGETWTDVNPPQPCGFYKRTSQ